MKLFSELLKAGSFGDVAVEFYAPDQFEQGRMPALLLAAGGGHEPGERIKSLIANLLVPRGWLLITFAFPPMPAWGKSPTALVSLRKIYSHVVRKLLVHNRFRPGPLFGGGAGLGARIATHVAREIRFTGLVLLSYPLHPPWQPQLLRHQHLYLLDMPVLFVSGTRDPCALPPLIANVAERMGPSARLLPLHGANQDFLIQAPAAPAQRDLDARIIDELEGWMRAVLVSRAHPEPGRE